ncbi:MAG: flagellar biosynthetic protein FliQ [Pirellulaceae bacterium]
MEFNEVVFVGRSLLTTALLLVAPVVIVSLVVGLFISIGQTVTSIQEQTMAFAPKIVAVVVVLLIGLPWYLQQLQSFTTNLFTFMTDVVR